VQAATDAGRVSALSAVRSVPEGPATGTASATPRAFQASTTRCTISRPGSATWWAPAGRRRERWTTSQVSGRTGQLATAVPSFPPPSSPGICFERKPPARLQLKRQKQLLKEAALGYPRWRPEPNPCHKALSELEFPQPVPHLRLLYRKRRPVPLLGRLWRERRPLRLRPRLAPLNRQAGKRSGR
jgi:hypothetical protein